MTQRDDFPSIALVFLLGMLVPGVVVLAFLDVISLYLSGRQFLVLSAALFGIGFWVLLVVFDLDRVNVVVASLALPWFFALVVLLAFGRVGGFDFRLYLFQGFPDLLVYGFVFMVAGIAAVVVQREIERFSAEHEWVPTPRTVVFGVVVLVAVSVVAGGAVMHLTASSAEVSSIDSTAGEHDSPYFERASLDVTVDGEHTELRLRVTAPDGSTTIERLSRSDLQDGTATVRLPFWRFEASDPQIGTYHVELTSLVGLTVDSERFTVETGPVPSLASVETAPPGEELDLELPPDSPSYYPDSDVDTRVGVVVENQGDIADDLQARLLVDDERLARQQMFLEPGQRGGVVFALPDDDVELIHERANGTLTVEVYYGDERDSETVTVPEP